MKKDEYLRMLNGFQDSEEGQIYERPSEEQIEQSFVDAQQLQKKYPNIRYFFSDLKKDGGLEKGNALVREYDIYRQNYCGCLYSYQEMLQRARSTFEAQ